MDNNPPPRPQRTIGLLEPKQEAAPHGQLAIDRGPSPADNGPTLPTEAASCTEKNY